MVHEWSWSLATGTRELTFVNLACVIHCDLPFCSVAMYLSPNVIQDRHGQSIQCGAAGEDNFRSPLGQDLQISTLFLSDERFDARHQVFTVRVDDREKRCNACHDDDHVSYTHVFTRDKARFESLVERTCELSQPVDPCTEIVKLATLTERSWSCHLRST